jgi:predicted AlkP superfamily phosphohydrolase/phosphomutase
MSEMAHRVLVIGLDAATFEIIDPLLAQGKMPHLKRLIDQGVRGRLASTHPPLSPAAWTSFMTGKNPGKHGIFDFKNYEPSHYDRRTGGRLVNATQFAGTTLFDIASTAGKKVGAFKVPITYPAWPVNGFMVSGQPLPDTQTQPTAYPPSLMQEVSNDSITFDHHMDAFKQADLDQFIEDIQRSNAKSVQQVLKLLAADDYDLFVLVLTALDEIQHRLWMYTDPACPVYDAEHNARYGQVINDFYCEMDAVVGQILAQWAHADDGLVFVI